MSSSTSSSEEPAEGAAPSRAKDRAPAGRWGASWAAALVLAVGVLGGWEGFWRHLGFLPTFRDDTWSWSYQRSKASSGDPETVVLLGMSAIQAAVDVDLFARETGGPKPIHLEITGSSPLPVLEDLAQDESFVGLALCGYIPGSLYDPELRGDALPGMILTKYHRASQSPYEWIERRLRLAVQGRAAFRLWFLSPGNLLSGLLGGRLPRLNHLRVSPDRSLTFVYTHVAPQVTAGARKTALTPPVYPTDDELEARLARIAAAVESIRARGGAVAFVNFSCEGPYRGVFENLYPREYWDILGTRTHAVLLDVTAVPDLERLRCSDGGHLDAPSKIPFTKALVKLVKERIPR